MLQLFNCAGVCRHHWQVRTEGWGRSLSVDQRPRSNEGITAKCKSSVGNTCPRSQTGLRVGGYSLTPVSW